MIIRYNQPDNLNKIFQILDGTFSIERSENFSWIWTTTKVNGIVSNVDYIIIKALSEIDNILFYDNNQIEIKSNCLNIIKLNTAGKQEFNFRLENTFIPDNDNRELGLKIVGILVDGDVIF